MANPPSTKRPLFCIAIIAIAFIWMTVSTWLIWPDAMYDFGTHLYVPWQLSLGRHLYIDIAYFNGPFSEYFNAAMFKLFGVGVHTLMLVNAGILLLVIAVVFKLIHLLGDAITAASACVMFIVVFAFARYDGIGIGNYNWICPYLHEVTHGIALSLAMVLAIALFFRSGKSIWLISSAILLGLVLLTKAEVSAPAVAAFGVAIFLSLRLNPSRKRLQTLILSIGVIAAVVLIAFAIMALFTTPTAAMRGLLGSWPWVFNRQIAQLEFYQRGLGTDDLAGNLWRMTIIGLASLVLLGGVVAVGIAPPRWRSIAIIAFTIELVIVAINHRWAMQVARPWPVFLLTVALISIIHAWRTRLPAPAIRAVLAVLALGLLGKMLFNARPWQYGFALAMPAALALTEAIAGWLPSCTRRRGFEARWMRCAGLALVATITICLYFNQTSAARFTVAVGAPADRFLAGQRGAEVERARRAINQLVSPTGTLAVMPQGLMLNFLTRRANPIAVVNIMPPEVMSVGEDQIISALNAHPPDAIVLSEKDIDNGSFVLADGNYHYGAKILGWVMQHYRCAVPAYQGSELQLSTWLPTQRK